MIGVKINEPDPNNNDTIVVSVVVRANFRPCGLAHGFGVVGVISGG
jgi:hypothetical protein